MLSFYECDYTVWQLSIRTDAILFEKIHVYEYSDSFIMKNNCKYKKGLGNVHGALRSPFL
jgi:hypothetical protein